MTRLYFDTIFVMTGPRELLISPSENRIASIISFPDLKILLLEDIIKGTNPEKPNPAKPIPI